MPRMLQRRTNTTQQLLASCMRATGLLQPDTASGRPLQIDRHDIVPHGVSQCVQRRLECLLSLYLTNLHMALNARLAGTCWLPPDSSQAIL